MARNTWTAPPGWLRFFNKINIGRQTHVVGAFAKATEAFEKGAEKVAVFRIEPR
jgi:hypothetical protein